MRWRVPKISTVVSPCVPPWPPCASTSLSCSVTARWTATCGWCANWWPPGGSFPEQALEREETKTGRRLHGRRPVVERAGPDAGQVLVELGIVDEAQLGHRRALLSADRLQATPH